MTPLVGNSVAQPKEYRISSYSLRGNYSFLNLTFGDSTYKCGNYSRKETIQGRKLFKGGNYSRKYGTQKMWGHK
jgi:hypothetical protein